MSPAITPISSGGLLVSWSFITLFPLPKLISEISSGGNLLV